MERKKSFGKLRTQIDSHTSMRPSSSIYEQQPLQQQQRETGGEFWSSEMKDFKDKFTLPTEYPKIPSSFVCSNLLLLIFIFYFPMLLDLLSFQTYCSHLDSFFPSQFYNFSLSLLLSCYYSNY
jgi:hypothetical protein